MLWWILKIATPLAATTDGSTPCQTNHVPKLVLASPRVIVLVLRLSTHTPSLTLSTLCLATQPLALSSVLVLTRMRHRSLVAPAIPLVELETVIWSSSKATGSAAAPLVVVQWTTLLKTARSVNGAIGVRPHVQRRVVVACSSANAR